MKQLDQNFCLHPNADDANDDDGGGGGQPTRNLILADVNSTHTHRVN